MRAIKWDTAPSAQFYLALGLFNSTLAKHTTRSFSATGSYEDECRLTRACVRNPFFQNFVANFVGFRPFSTKFPTNISPNVLLRQPLTNQITQAAAR